MFNQRQKIILFACLQAIPIDRLQAIVDDFNLSPSGTSIGELRRCIQTHFNNLNESIIRVDIPPETSPAIPVSIIHIPEDTPTHHTYAVKVDDAPTGGLVLRRRSK